MASSRWNMLRNGSYRDLLPVEHNDRDTAEQATAGSRMWDKLLMATGSVSKTIASRIKDTGYDSADDEEGVDTHVIKCLRDYYTNAGDGIPTWLGGMGTLSQATSTDARSGYPQQQQQHGGTSTLTRSTTGQSRNKVSLRGIYEQAQERTASQQRSPQRPGDSGAPMTSMTRQLSSTQRSDGAGSVQPGVSAGERFRERMKQNRATAATSGHGNGVQADPSRDAGRLRRAGTGPSAAPGSGSRF
ncbi:hypothetical protein BCR37DRAFT_377215 [Protomyces lactucae-debilis]|uniref:Mso1 N-terminal domain-containing protein n=1 Tax=Protomyces lactucae-debilis TaxID=2754530 RepID=A0A1Y2FNG8_PROLT|nr:uncharacterized protein BCR37DRAFT_377215 [Protomyces lactucae-debilis]ORY85542.1 hypothetical protein BCR37DRAFT_377215 [Protomyces lactucae-debilis]